MPNIDLSFAQDPNTLSLALIYGMIPAVIWMYYWLRENRERPRHSGLLTGAFVGGMAMVILALPVEKFLATLSNDTTILTIYWASAEELLKFLIFALVILRSKTAIEEPIDYAIYIMVVAFGFAGFENALYLLQPLQAGDTLTLFLSGTMRFLGTTLMHAVTASLAGIALGFTYYGSKIRKIIAVCIGIVIACISHSMFNLYIVQNGGLDFFQVFAVLWIAVIGILFAFERLRHMSTPEYRRRKIQGAFAHLKSEFDRLLKELRIVATEEMPLITILSRVPKEVHEKEAMHVHAFLDVLRDFYREYLVSLNTDAVKIEEIVAKLVPETITPKAIGGIIAALQAGVLKKKSEPQEGPL